MSGSTTKCTSTTPRLPSCLANIFLHTTSSSAISARNAPRLPPPSPPLNPNPPHTTSSMASPSPSSAESHLFTYAPPAKAPPRPKLVCLFLICGYRVENLMRDVVSGASAESLWLSARATSAWTGKMHHAARVRAMVATRFHKVPQLSTSFHVFPTFKSTEQCCAPGTSFWW